MANRGTSTTAVGMKPMRVLVPCRPTSATMVLRRSLGLTGDDDPQGQVKEDAGSSEHGQDNKEHPDQGRVDVEVLGQRALDLGLAAAPSRLATTPA
jgi:hypothetical protein